MFGSDFKTLAGKNCLLSKEILTSEISVSNGTTCPAVTINPLPTWNQLPDHWDLDELDLT